MLAINIIHLLDCSINLLLLLFFFFWVYIFESWEIQYILKKGFSCGGNLESKEEIIILVVHVVRVVGKRREVRGF